MNVSSRFSPPLRQVLFALSLLLASGCGSDRVHEEELDTEFLELRIRMEGLADQLVAESMEKTRAEPFVFEDGREGVRRVPVAEPVVIPSEPWVPLGGDPIVSPGDGIAEFPLDRRPWALLIDNAGTCVMAGPDEVRIVPEEGDARTLGLSGVTSLAWNADGSLLLADSPDVKRLLLWPSADSEINLLEEGFRGRLHFAPQSGAIWQVTDLIDPDPSSEVRVLLTAVRERAPGGTQDKDLLTGPRALAGIGTLPQVGQAWGHRIRSGMILPRPAPLWLLDDDLRPSRMITDSGNDVDFRPVSSADGTIVFLRTRRIIDADDSLRLAASTRAWITSLAEESSGRLLTGEPTYAAAISPNGEHLAFLVERDGMMQLIRTNLDAMAALDFDESQAAIRLFESQVVQTIERLREVWLSTAWHDILEANEIAYEFPLEGAEDVLPLMAKALRDSLAEDHGIVLPDSRAAIGLLDAWLLAADGLIAEENATVLAVGALYGELLAREPDVNWDYLAILPAFSNDLLETTEAEGDLYRLHSPFLAAREAIAGRLPLTEAASQALGDQRRAVGLVENFGTRARAGFAISELQRAGIETDGEVATDTWRRIADEQTGNMIANEAAWSAATARGEAGIAFAAAMNMARHNPTSPRALLRFARELMLAGMDGAAMTLFDQAAVLAPDDPEVRLAVATAFFDLYRLDEAEAMLEQIARDFPAEAEVVEDHLEVMKTLRESVPDDASEEGPADE